MLHEQFDEVTKVLLRGRRRVEKGWCQGAMRRGEDFCAVGACTDYPMGGTFMKDNEWAALDILTAALRSNNRLVSAFNDAPTTTQQDVIKLFDKAIAISMAKHHANV